MAACGWRAEGGRREKGEGGSVHSRKRAKPSLAFRPSRVFFPFLPLCKRRSAEAFTARARLYAWTVLSMHGRKGQKGRRARGHAACCVCHPLARFPPQPLFCFPCGRWDAVSGRLLLSIAGVRAAGRRAEQSLRGATWRRASERGRSAPRPRRRCRSASCFTLFFACMHGERSGTTGMLHGERRSARCRCVCCCGTFWPCLGAEHAVDDDLALA